VICTLDADFHALLDVSSASVRRSSAFVVKECADLTSHPHFASSALCNWATRARVNPAVPVLKWLSRWFVVALDFGLERVHFFLDTIQLLLQRIRLPDTR
jgi:hypothetical protein